MMIGGPTISPEGGELFLFYLGLAALGGLGGFLAELLQVIGSGRGTIELPHRPSKWRFNFGIFANVLIGAGAAAVATYLFPPTAYVSGSGTSQTTEVGYPVFTIVPLAIILGVAGSSVLSAATAKALAAINEQTALTTTEAATAALADVKSKSTAPNMTDEDKVKAIMASVDTSIGTIRAIGNSPGDDNGSATVTRLQR